MIILENKIYSFSLIVSYENVFFLECGGAFSTHWHSRIACQWFAGSKVLNKLEYDHILHPFSVLNLERLETKKKNPTLHARL